MNRRVFFTFTAMIMFAALYAARPASAEPWKMKEFMISVWGGPADDAFAAVFKDAHFNTVMVKPEMLDLCKKHGLRALVMNSDPAFAAANKDNPLVWGWFVRDEPKPEEYAAYTAPVAALHAADPNHPAYINLVSSHDADAFFEAVNPRIMSYDFYQWWWGSYTHYFFLDKFRRVAEREGVPLLVWVEVNSDPRWEYGKPGADYPADNLAKIRQSVFTSLADGAKGIQWFVESLMFKRGDGGKLLPELMPAGEDVKKINIELEALGPELIGLKSLGAFHTNPIVYETERMPASDRWVKVKGKNITVGEFVDDAGVRRALVVNRDIAKKGSATLKFDAPAAKISRFDRWKRQWVVDSSGDTITLEIEPGDGELLKIE